MHPGTARVEERARSVNNKRVLTIALVLTAVTVCAVASWIAGARIQSPAEAAARTAPPTPSPILVPVEERVLSSDVVTRGTARFGQPTTIAIAPSPLKADAGVITMLPARGTQIDEGAVLLTASGRPVFVLQGDFPAYRDLVPGLAGDDVLQFEMALQRLGHEPGEADGTYDEATATAVTEWYAAAGWSPFAATAEQLTTIRALEQELSAAENARLAAEDAVATAELAVNAAQAELWSATSAAQASVAELGATREALWRDWAPDEDRAIADANLAAAKAAAGAAYSSGQASVQAALDAQKAAEREAAAAATLVDQLTADLALAQRDAGVKVPLDEVVFIPSLPVRVESLETAIGDAASGPVLTVTNNQLAVDASLPLEEAPLVKSGMPVTIDEPDLGVAATGIVERVADTPGTNGVDGFHIYLEVLVTETPASLEGFSLRLTIPVESTAGKVTAVPISALSLAADGTTRVQVERDGGLVYVVVEPGLSADGFVEVTPVDGTLSPGERVVIGFE